MRTPTKRPGGVRKPPGQPDQCAGVDVTGEDADDASFDDE